MGEWQVTVLSVAATYLVHSTIFLVGCWLILWTRKKFLSRRSDTLVHLAWKGAAIGGVLTTLLHFFVGLGPTVDWRSLVSSGKKSTSESAEPYTVNFKPHSPNVSPLISQTDQWKGETEAGKIAQPLTGEASEDNTRDESLQATFRERPPSQFDLETAPNQIAQNLKSDSPGLPLSSDLGGKIDSHGEISIRSHEAAYIIVSQLLIFWLAVSLARMLLQSFWFQRRKSKYLSIDSGFERELLDQLRRELGIRRKINLLRATSHETPAAFGCFSWTIVLPCGVLAEVNREELRALIVHEIAHLRRGDVWWLAIGRILCGPLAFQPLNFLARARWQHASEFLCDRWATDHGTSALTLAKCLTSLASRKSICVHDSLVAAALGNHNSLIDRVQQLVSQEHSQDPWHSVIAQRFGVLLIGFFVSLVAVSIPGGRMFAIADEDYAPDLGWRISIDGYHYYEDENWENVDESMDDLNKDLERLLALAQRSKNRSNLEPALVEIRKTLSSLNARREKLNPSDF